MIEAMRTNADILAQLALLGTEQNRLEDFLLDPSRGVKLMQALVAFDPGATGFKTDHVYAAAHGISRLTEALLDHLIAKYKGNDRVKNVIPSGNLLLQLRAGPALDRKSLNRAIGTFYLDWPYAAHWRRDLYRIPEGGLTVFGLVYGGLQKLRDLLDEQTGLA
ncbi:MAG: hypothetical protein WCT04_13260 [Planctomycetota bacterium]